MNNPRVVKVGSRGSILARTQAEMVVEELLLRHPSLKVERVVVSTSADRSPTIPLEKLGDKAVWVADLEQALLSGDIDVAVHSAKDMPAILPEGLMLLAPPSRECPLDALVLPQSAEDGAPDEANPDDWRLCLQMAAKHLPAGSRIGTSSDRRRGQLLLWRPDLKMIPVRGNVDTRLAKLDSGVFDALVLAAAGLRRLGRKSRISALFPSSVILPAAGQGTLGIEVRENDEVVRALMAGSGDPATELELVAERSFVCSVGGGCSVPLGVSARCSNQRLSLQVRGVWPDGHSPVEVDGDATLNGETDCTDAEDLGRRVADLFLQSGGSDLIEQASGRSFDVSNILQS